MKKHNKIAFTVDLDDWYHTPLVAGADFSHYPTVQDFFKDWDQEYDFVTKASEQLLKLLQKHQIRATFFVIADMVEKYPKLMKMLKESSHEIAHHSLHHTIPYNTKSKTPTQPKEIWEKELITAKEILEKYFERPIVGYRAPGAYFASWMIPLLIKNGFQYDSSVVFNSLYNKSDMDLSVYPRNIFKMNAEGKMIDDFDEGLWEIPWPSLKFRNLYLPGGGAFFFRALGYAYFRKLLYQNLALGDTVFYIHSLDLSEEKIPINNFKNRPFYWINKGGVTFRRLDKLLHHFQSHFCSCRDILEHY